MDRRSLNWSVNCLLLQEDMHKTRLQSETAYTELEKDEVNRVYTMSGTAYDPGVMQTWLD